MNAWNSALSKISYTRGYRVVQKNGSVSKFMRRVSGSSMREFCTFVLSALRRFASEVLGVDVDKTCFVVRGVGSGGIRVEGCSEAVCVVGGEACYFGRS